MSPQPVRGREAGGSGVHHQLLLKKEFEAYLGYMRSCSNKTNKKNTEAWGMAQTVKSSMYKHEDLSSIPKATVQTRGVT